MSRSVLIYPVHVKPPSKIARWEDWPNDVRGTIWAWNKNHVIRLSFVRTAHVFKCADCAQFCRAHPNGCVCLRGRSPATWLCDDCTIARARAMGPTIAAYGRHRRAGRVTQSCICPSPKRLEDGYDWQIDPACPYHQLAAEFPDDHSIPWNCPTYWDGCNCTRPRKPR